MSASADALLVRLQRLQSRFTWNLDMSHVDLKNLSTRLENHIDLQEGPSGAMAITSSTLAYVRFLQGQSKEAFTFLDQSECTIKECFASESERRLVVVYGDRAWLNYKTRDLTRAKEFCQRVEQIQSKYATSSSSIPAEVYGEKGWTFLKVSKSHYPKAIKCFREALKLQPDDAEWNAGCAIAMYREEPRMAECSGEVEASPVVKQLRRALEIRPDDGVLLALLALKMAAFKEHEEAEKLVEKALKVDPDNPHATRYIAKYCRNQGDVDRSINLLQRALQKSSNSGFVHHQLALCYKQKKIREQTRRPQNMEKVNKWRRLTIQHLEEALTIRPTFRFARAEIALMYGEQKDFSRAEEFFQQAFADTPERDKTSLQFVHQRYGDFHMFHTKNDSKAIEHFTEGLQLEKDTWEAKQCIKRLKAIAGRRLSEDPNDHQALGLRGLVATAEGDLDHAVQLYQRALDRDPGNQDHLSALMDLQVNLETGSD